MKTRSFLVERKGIEPSTFALRTRLVRVESIGYRRLAGVKPPFQAVPAHKCRTEIRLKGERGGRVATVATNNEVASP